MGGRAATFTITQDAANKLVTMADAGSNLVLRLNYDGRCLLDQVIVRGRRGGGAGDGRLQRHTGFQSVVHDALRHPAAEVAVSGNKVTVSEIVYGGAGVQVKETWKFTVQPDRIDWQIDRNYLSGGRLEDTYFPGWDFQGHDHLDGWNAGRRWSGLEQIPGDAQCYLRRARWSGDLLESGAGRLPANQGSGAGVPPVQGASCPQDRTRARRPPRQPGRLPHYSMSR